RRSASWRLPRPPRPRARHRFASVPSFAALAGRRVSHQQLAPHEVVAGAAHAGALEHVAPRLWRAERHGNFASATLRDYDVDAGARDPEPMRGIVTAHAHLDLLAGIDHDLRRREGEALRADADDAPLRLG